MINLKKYFEEKELGYKEWEIKVNGMTHFISNQVVIEAILDAPKEEQEKISKIISKIDFQNGKINHFLRHLAEGLVLG